MVGEGLVQLVSRHIPSQVRKPTAALPRVPSGGLEETKGRLRQECI